MPDFIWKELPFKSHSSWQVQFEVYVHLNQIAIIIKTPLEPEEKTE